MIEAHTQSQLRPFSLAQQARVFLRHRAGTATQKHQPIILAFSFGGRSEAVLPTVPSYRPAIYTTAAERNHALIVGGLTRPHGTQGVETASQFIATKRQTPPKWLNLTPNFEHI